jgi:hypothetical protein
MKVPDSFLGGSDLNYLPNTFSLLLSPVVQDNFREFPYRLELFRHVSSTILADVAQKIPQEALSPERVRALQAPQTANRNTAALLGAFDVAISMLNKTGGDPNQGLVEYAQQWLPGHAVRRFEEPALGGFQLRHVCAVYEALEECVADVIMASSDGIDKNVYRAPLPPDVRRELLRSTDLYGGSLSADVFARALKRFAVRFLTSERCRPDVPASLYLADADFMAWPEGAIAIRGVSLEDAFPESLLVGHVWEAYEVLMEHAQVREKRCYFHLFIIFILSVRFLVSCRGCGKRVGSAKGLGGACSGVAFGCHHMFSFLSFRISPLAFLFLNLAGHVRKAQELFI